DSAESLPQPKCHPETRTEMLEDLREWALNTNPETTILWLYGPAGAGKSAIMQTLARQLQDTEGLGSCFFFKRGHATRGNGKTLFATIAYQLAPRVPWLRTPISEIVEDNASLVVLSIETQMEKLISQPCRPYGNRDPLAILIDGLDECEGHVIQEGILRAIRNSSSKHPIPLRFIIASRPEAHIREMFDSPVYVGNYRAFNVQQSFDDVHKYLRDEFSRIHREYHTMANIPSPWPSPDVLQRLVWNSSGHFIYASTIIKFMDDKNYRPMERLAVVQDGKGTESEAAFDPLDQLYKAILRSAPRQSHLMPILCAIAHFDLAVSMIDQFFGLADGDTRLVLRGLHSVLRVPSSEYEIIYSHHASFLDFLNNSSRSQNFYVGSIHHRMDVSRSFLKFLGGQYQQPWNSSTSMHRYVQIIPKTQYTLPTLSDLPDKH
ncbi:hypothetical protein C8R45DRAFT_834599, partial [Mycena sanguinolenta]